MSDSPLVDLKPRALHADVLVKTPARRLGHGSPLAEQIRERRRRWWLIRFAQAALLCCALLMWQVLADPRGGDSWALIDTYYVSQPSDVVQALIKWQQQGELIGNVLQTAEVTALGLFFGIVFGLVVGFLLGVSPDLSAILNPFIAALYSIPRLALIPLLLLWFGIGTAPKLAMVIIMVFFLVFYSTYSGVKDVDSQLISVLRVMGASRWQVYRVVTLPAAMMFIITGLRIAMPYALVGAVTAEMIVGDGGLGFLAIRSAGQFYTAGVFGSIVLMMLMAMFLTGLLNLYERWALRWK